MRLLAARVYCESSHRPIVVFVNDWITMILRERIYGASEYDRPKPFPAVVMQVFVIISL